VRGGIASRSVVSSGRPAGYRTYAEPFHAPVAFKRTCFAAGAVVWATALPPPSAASMQVAKSRVAIITLASSCTAAAIPPTYARVSKAFFTTSGEVRWNDGVKSGKPKVASFRCWETLMTSNAELVRHLYDRFNARDIDGVLSALAEDVAWANGMDGGHVHGREAVRKYWTRQWAVIDPHVDPVHVADPIDGSTLVNVHQVVKDLEGKVLLDETIAHRFQFEGNFVTRFDIEGASELSTIGH
jgi:hypothetical protein